jgi:hypothetical protein
MDDYINYIVYYIKDGIVSGAWPPWLRWWCRPTSFTAARSVQWTHRGTSMGKGPIGVAWAPSINEASMSELQPHWCYTSKQESAWMPAHRSTDGEGQQWCLVFEFFSSFWIWEQSLYSNLSYGKCFWNFLSEFCSDACRRWAVTCLFDSTSTIVINGKMDQAYSTALDTTIT